MMPEPAAAMAPTPPPEDLDPESRAIWEDLRPELEAKGLLAPRYAELFRVLCETIAMNRRLGRFVIRMGPLVRESLREGERPVVNPGFRAYRQSSELLIRLGAEFGLSPGSVTGMARDAGRALKDQKAENDPRRLFA